MYFQVISNGQILMGILLLRAALFIFCNIDILLLFIDMKNYPMHHYSCFSFNIKDFSDYKITQLIRLKYD